MNSLSRFIRNEGLILFILFLVIINPYLTGYRAAVVLLGFFFFRFEFLMNNLDRKVLFIGAFTLSYEIFSALRPDAAPRSLVLIGINTIIPIMLYLSGKYIGIRCFSAEIALAFIYFLGFTFSLVPMISILLQIGENGFLSGTRSMSLIWNNDIEFNATGLAGYFVLNVAGLGLINVKRSTRFERILLYFCFVTVLVSLVCIIRLGSRTLLGVGAFAIILSFFLNFAGKRKFQYLIGTIVLIGCTIFAMMQFDGISEFFTFYSDRVNDSEAGIDKLGGRTERWTGSLTSILTDPFGWEFTRYGYAHNLWLDVARVAGIVPLVFLVYFTVYSGLECIIFSKKLRAYPFLRTYVLLAFVSIMVVFSLEPVMEGLYLLFLVFCIFVGFVTGINKQLKHVQRNP